MTKGCVPSWKRDADSNPIGRVHANFILDTQQYVIEAEDGDETKPTANLIAESMYAQCDPNGNQYVLLDSIIVDHRRLDSAFWLCDQQVIQNNRRTYMRCNTIDWQMCCQWKEGSTYWENLVNLMESHPIKTAEYAKTLDIDHKPAFTWWVPHVLKKWDRLISMVRKRTTRYLNSLSAMDGRDRPLLN